MPVHPIIQIERREKKMKRREMISGVVLVLGVLVSAGSFRANLAYAQFPGTTITLGEQYTT
jgi:hypothetical protein